MELTQKAKPVIIISLHEIAQTHSFILQNLDKLVKDNGKYREETKEKLKRERGRRWRGGGREEEERTDNIKIG